MPLNNSVNYLFHYKPTVKIFHVRSASNNHLMFRQSNCPLTELMLSAVLVQQFGIASWNTSEIHRFPLMSLGSMLRHSCLLVVNSCDTSMIGTP